MKSTGIVRKLDLLGRIVIPMELRYTLGLEERCPMEIFIDGDYIVLKKYSNQCIVCGDNNMGNLVIAEGAALCRSCLKLFSEKEKL